MDEMANRWIDSLKSKSAIRLKILYGHKTYDYVKINLDAGYARLNDAFEIEEWLQIKLKFKTTVQDGVILAMGNVG